MSLPEKANVAEKLSLFEERWSPRIIADLNGQEGRTDDHVETVEAGSDQESRWVSLNHALCVVAVAEDGKGFEVLKGLHTGKQNTQQNRQTQRP